MKIYPMCGMPQLEAGVTVCQFCDYEEKPVQELSKQEIYDLLDSKGISYQKIEHLAAFTMEQMEEYGVTKKGTVCKNLFLRDFKGKNHFLVTAHEHKRVDLRTLAEKAQKRLEERK